VLEELGQPQPLLQQRGDELPQAVVPLVGDGVLEPHLGLDVGPRLVPHGRLRTLEVRVLHHQRPVRADVGQCPHHRVPLAQEQAASRSQQPAYDGGPSVDVRQPAQGTDPGVHKVEASLTERVDGVVHLRLDEVGPRPGAVGEPPCLLDRGGAEVEPGHAGAEPLQRQRVGAQVALQVDAAQPRDRPQPGQVETHHVGEVLGVGDESVDRVVG
jgi:hypothetical protein